MDTNKKTMAKMTSDIDEDLLQYLRDKERIKPIKQLVIENDNPAWLLLVRYGYTIACEDDKRHARVLTFNRDSDVEIRLPGGHSTLFWNGCKFEVDLTVEESKEIAKITFDDDQQGYVAFSNFLRHCRQRHHEKSEVEQKRLVCKVLRSGIWRTVSSYPKRSIHSVITGTQNPLKLVEDMKTFLNSEEEYNKFGFPFKRNYLVIGPPGSGKSSLVAAAASELDFDVCYITITPESTEQSLCAGICSLTERSMLVIEDADVICNTANTGSPSAQAALAVLTNVLDGTLHKHGLITVLTSAAPENLDSILVRHGRIDHTCKLDPLSEQQLSVLIDFTMENEPTEEKQELTRQIWDSINNLGLTSTTLIHFLFRNRKRSIREIISNGFLELSRGTREEHITEHAPKIGMYF